MSTFQAQQKNNMTYNRTQNFPVTSIEHLKELSLQRNGEAKEYFILLSGICRSSKRILYYPDEDKFWILNWIDDSEQELRTEELEAKTNIVKHMKEGTFIFDDYL